jgi:hypothetical protein
MKEGTRCENSFNIKESEGGGRNGDRTEKLKGLKSDKGEMSKRNEDIVTGLLKA